MHSAPTYNNYIFPFLGGFLLSILISCNQKQNSTAKETTQPLKIPSSFNDTFVIRTPAAVFYGPDSLQLEKMKASIRPSEFDATQHEFYYLQKNARNLIREFNPTVPVLEVTNKRYLLFAANGVVDTCLDLNNYFDAYGLFLYQPAKMPHLTDMANIDRELAMHGPR
jgi:hypothetical protein